MTTPNDLLGGWVLARWDYTVDDEFRGYPMGEDAKGQIMYTENGRMSAILMRPDRPRFQLPHLHRGTPDEIREAALGYVSYGGSFDLVDEVVTHHVEFALFPNWIGTDLVREVSWDGDQLVLTGAPEMTTSGSKVVNRLFWRRP